MTNDQIDEIIELQGVYEIVYERRTKNALGTSRIFKSIKTMMAK